MTRDLPTWRSLLYVPASAEKFVAIRVIRVGGERVVEGVVTRVVGELGLQPRDLLQPLLRLRR